MRDKPQFYIRVNCVSPDEKWDEQIARDFPLSRIYKDKNDVRAHMEDILKLPEIVGFCRKSGNLKPSIGSIFTEHEYREIKKGQPSTI